VEESDVEESDVLISEINDDQERFHDIQILMRYRMQG